MTELSKGRSFQRTVATILPKCTSFSDAHLHVRAAEVYRRMLEREKSVVRWL